MLHATKTTKCPKFIVLHVGEACVQMRYIYLFNILIVFSPVLLNIISALINSYSVSVYALIELL